MIKIYIRFGNHIGHVVDKNGYQRDVNCPIIKDLYQNNNKILESLK